jgi:aminopeptidase N
VRDIHDGSLGYSGEATIHIEILETTNHIVLHSKNQQIEEIAAVDLNGEDEIAVVGYQINDDFETLVVYFGNQLKAGTKFAITINYTTNLITSSGFGFYQTSYEVDGVIKYVGATQFEETNARLAFPCYDGEKLKKKIYNFQIVKGFMVLVMSCW